MKTIKFFFSAFFSCSIFGLIGLGVYYALRSPLFHVQLVDISIHPTSFSVLPLSQSQLVELSGIHLNQENLFFLDLSSIEQKLLLSDWIQSIEFQKEFPHTLRISLKLRKPLALFQLGNGTLVFLDRNGILFGKLGLGELLDLPVVSGLSPDDAYRIWKVTEMLHQWEHVKVESMPLLSSVSWDVKEGYRFYVVYPLRSSQIGRAIVYMGEEPYSDFSRKLMRLSQVFRYLEENSVKVGQVWADIGKKVTVKALEGYSKGS